MSATEPKKMVTRVPADGEVVLPAELGSAKRWARGTEVGIVARGEGYVVRKHSPAPNPRPKITREEFLARVPKYEGPVTFDKDFARRTKATPDAIPVRLL